MGTGKTKFFNKKVFIGRLLSNDIQLHQNLYTVNYI